MATRCPMSDQALRVLAGLVLDDGRQWGAVATSDQWSDARAVLDQSAPQRRHWLGRARGYSKTVDAGGLSIAAMLTQLRPGATAYAAAADRDQARLILDAIRGFVHRTPGLRGVLDVQAYRVLGPRGITLDILAADGPGAWGLRPDWLIKEEAAQWPDTANAREVDDALMTALPKVAGSRLVVITSAGDPAHWSHADFERALDEPERWRVSHLDGPAPWMDPAELAAEERRLLPAVYARLFLNRWTTGEDRLTSRDVVESLAVLDGPLLPQRGKRYVIGLDIGVTNDRTAAVVAHLERGTDRGSPDRWNDNRGESEFLTRWRAERFGERRPVEHQTEAVKVVVDRIAVWAGSRLKPVSLTEVTDWVFQAAVDYGGIVAYDPYQAVQLSQELRAQGVLTEPFTFSSGSVGRLAATLHRLLREKALAIPRDPDLIDELVNVRLRETSPGVFRLDHDRGKHDDRAIALALAAHHLIDGTDVERRVYARPQVVVQQRWGRVAGNR